MHKFFANTLFLGKKVIFLTECHSTNDYLHHLARSENLPDGTVVWTDYQHGGKGQRGNRWESAPSQNLLVSVSLKLPWLPVRKQYLLSFVAGIAIRETLQGLLRDHVSVKWPNDVYVRDRKVCGILCEANLSGSVMESAIIGFGINVNQDRFADPGATSLRLETGRMYDREEVLADILLSMEKWYHQLKSGQEQAIIRHYTDHLLGIGEERAFESGGRFEGRITGVDDKGNLRVLVTRSDLQHLQAGEERSFGLQEIRWLL